MFKYSLVPDILWYNSFLQFYLEYMTACYLIRQLRWGRGCPQFTEVKSTINYSCHYVSPMPTKYCRLL